MSKYLFIILVFSCFISSCLKNDEDLSLKKKLKILEEYYKQTGDIDEKTNFNCHDFLRFHQNSFIPERSSKKNFSTILTHYQYKSQKNNNIEGINIASFLLSENYFSKKILSIINSNPNEINLSLKEILPELLILFESKAPLQHKNSILNKEHIKNIISNAYDQLQTTKQREALLEIISKTYKDFFKKYSKIPLKEWLRQDVFFPLKNKDVFISKNGLKIKNFIEKYSYAESLLHDSELISKCLAIKIKEYKHYNHENKCSKHNFLLESLILHQVNLQNKENIKNINQIFRENNEKTDCTSIPNKIWVKFSHKDDNIETKKYIFHHYNILFVDSFYKEERKWNRNLNSFFEKCLRHNIPIEISKKMKTIAPLKIMLNTDIDLKIGVAEYLPEFKSIVLFKNGNTCTSFIHEIFHHLDYELKIKDQWAKLLRYANFITKNPLSLEKKETLSLYFGKDFPRNYSKTHIIEDIATSLEHAIFYPWELQRISPARFKLVQKIFNFKISPQKKFEDLIFKTSMQKISPEETDIISSGIRFYGTSLFKILKQKDIENKKILLIKHFLIRFSYHFVFNAKEEEILDFFNLLTKSEKRKFFSFLDLIESEEKKPYVKYLKNYTDHKNKIEKVIKLLKQKLKN